MPTGVVLVGKWDIQSTRREGFFVRHSGICQIANAVGVKIWIERLDRMVSSQTWTRARMLVQGVGGSLMGTCGFYSVGAGRSYQIGKVRLTFKPFIGQGDYSLCESSSSPGSGAGLHRHPFDEWHIILEGSYECQVGHETRILGPGEMMFAAGGVAHRIKNLGPGPGRQIGISSPAGRSEAFFSALANSGADSGNPSKAGGASFREIAANHSVEFIDS